MPAWRTVVLAALVLLTAAGDGLADGRADEPGEPPRDPAGLALDFYQHYLSSLRHARCRFHPSCSEYARLAIARHGLFGGAARAADRLMRCNASAGRFYAR
ncbi:membrane protein insertion efficiency factor YidD, partial [bacterium]|nr:membrane protein insertion efficiency factor YidD [bacterium]